MAAHPIRFVLTAGLASSLVFGGGLSRAPQPEGPECVCEVLVVEDSGTTLVCKENFPSGAGNCEDVKQVLEDSEHCYPGEIPRDSIIDIINAIMTGSTCAEKLQCLEEITGSPPQPGDKEKLCGDGDEDETEDEIEDPNPEDEEAEEELPPQPDPPPPPPPNGPSPRPRRGPVPGVIEAISNPDDDDATCEVEGDSPISADPVQMITGDKFERVTDVVVKLPGHDFKIVREYTSNTGFNHGNLVGKNWALSPFRSLRVNTSGANPVLSMYGPPMAYRHEYRYDPGQSCWRTPGATTRSIGDDATVVIGASTYDVWRTTEPGGWEMDYYRAGGANDKGAKYEGLLAQRRDIYGNTATYEYVEYGPSGFEQPRLRKIHLNGEGATAAAQIWLRWNLGGSSSAIHGTLDYILVKRENQFGEWIDTQYIDYIYGEEIGSLSADVGAADDLVQVVTAERVDLPADSWYWGSAPHRAKITQYRYHDGSPAGSDPDERLNTEGDEHQLKAVILPEQIEFYAQQRNIGGAVADPSAAAFKAADELLAMDDDDEPATWPTSPKPKVLDLAAKLVSYHTSGAHEGKVAAQYLQSACGCASNAQGLKRVYAYVRDGSDDGTITSKIEEYLESSGSYTVHHRTLYWDIEMMGDDDAPYLVNFVIEESGVSPRRWVWRRAYDEELRPIRKILPSAVTSYTPAEPAPGNAAVVGVSSSAGLVLGYGWTDEHRLATTHFRQGDDPSLSNFSLLQEWTYPTAPTTSTKTYLPTSIKLYIDPSDTTTASKIQTTTYEYGFRSASSDPEPLAWVKTAVEAETESENGPSGSNTYSTHQLISDKGLIEWIRDEDNVLTQREYDEATGALVKVHRDQNVAELDEGDYGLSSGYITGWGSSTPETLTSEFKVDLLGRSYERVTPGGVRSFTVRELRSDPERPGMLYYGTVRLPHADSYSTPTEFDGPAVVTWFNASGDVTRRSEFTIDTTETYDPAADTDEDPTYTLDEEIARSATVHTLSGLVEKMREWHDVLGDRKYETTYEYDALGRMEFVTGPTGTVRHHEEYDVLDRLLKVGVGTSTSNTESVVEYFYDSGGAASQGTGDGNITLVRTRTGEGGELAADTRDTEYTYDFRNRLITIERPEAPHEFIEYDNLNRVTKRAMFEGPTVPTGIATPLSERGLLVESLYSQRGRPYRQKVAIDPTQASPSYLETNRWFDAAGRTIAEWSPNGPAVRRLYDAHGRVTDTYVTDRGGDALPGASGNYADASDLEDDIVLEQMGYTYNGDDRLELVTSVKRLHDASDTADGALDSSLGVHSYVGYAYDDFNRRIATINFGTNESGFISGGAAPSMGWPPAATSDPTSLSFGDAIITGITYNERGLADTSVEVDVLPLDVPPYTTDRLAKYFYDDLDRTIAVAENYNNATVTWSSGLDRWTVSNIDDAEPDVDRVTSYVLNGVGNVVKQIAHIPNGTSEDVQITEYSYGVTKGTATTHTDSLIYHNDLLKEARYPDETTGEPGSTDAYKVKYAYNRLGELRSIVDQNQTRHDYHRDALGRVGTDVVAALGTDISDWARRIEVGFDGLGRLTDVESYAATSGGSALNGVQFEYTPLWQVEKIYQDHNSAVTLSGGSPTGDTRKVEYTYSNQAPASGAAGSNFSRLTTLKLPHGTWQTYDFGTSGKPDDRISRIRATELVRSLSLESIADYRYVGLGMFAEVDLPAIDVQLDRTLAANGERRTQGYSTGTAGEYPGWDQFGRIVRHVWADGALTTHGTLTTVPNIPPILEETYTYDRASNRLSRRDARPGAAWADKDFEYGYDELNRLTKSERGEYTTSMAHAAGASTEWALDMLGNWNSVTTDDDGDGSFGGSDTVEEREHNAANELTSLDPDGTGGAPSQPFSYDDAGNLREGRGRIYTHDAWNRLVHVETDDVSPIELGEYEYYGLHWRSVKRSDTSQTPDGLDEQRLLYYNAAWQLVEERIDADYTGSPGTDSIAELFWGIRYIDDLMLRRVDESAAGTTFKRWYPLTDVQFSVRAVLRDDAGVHERINYSPYGVAEHHWGGDVDNDRSADFFDWLALGNQVALGSVGIGQANYVAEMDLNRDGVLDTDDANAIGSGTALPSGWISAAGAGNPGNVIGFDGYVFNPEIETYTVRFRWYDPELGRWLQRDPLAYFDGMNRYQYVVGQPAGHVDPLGLGPWAWLLTGDWDATDEEVEGAWTAFSMAANDRLNGYGDAVGVDGVAKHLGGTDYTFDEEERQKGECFANCLQAKPIDNLVDGTLDSLLPTGLGLIFDAEWDGSGIAITTGPPDADEALLDLIQGANGDLVKVGAGLWATGKAGELMADGRASERFRNASRRGGKIVSDRGLWKGTGGKLLALDVAIAALECLEECEECPTKYANSGGGGD